MIKVTNIETMNWQAALRGMRNPLNSWDKSDSELCTFESYGHCSGCGLSDYCATPHKNDELVIGPADLDLAKRLIHAGSDHRKFMRQIFVSMDITAPLYWWKEFDTYKVGTTANSCSTMHKIHAKEFTLDDFSHEHLIDEKENAWRWAFEAYLVGLNTARELFLETKDKRYWWQMIQLLPSSYNQLRTVTMNYENLLNMYHARRNHKLDEWRDFCTVITQLPYSELITGEAQHNPCTT